MDAELVKRAQKGEERAFEAIVVTCHLRLFRIAHGILRDTASAEDVVQRAFLESWRYLGRLHDRARFEAWTTGHLIEHCRLKVAASAGEADTDPEVASDTSVADPFRTFVDRDQLSRGFRQLSFDDRAVLVLRFLAEMDADDIATALSLEAGAVEGRVEEALRALEAALDGDDAPSGELTPQVEVA